MFTYKFLTVLFGSLLVSSIVAFSANHLVSDDERFDNGFIINQMAAESKVVNIPEGTFYFSTPILLDGCRTISIYGNLIYVGEKGKPSIVVKGNNVIFDLYGCLSYGKSPVFIGEKDNKTTIGIDFVNINNSRIYVNEIKQFNENIRVSGIGAGCSYNKFSFGIVRNCLTGLRIYQEDLDGKRGWTNENSFYGGRFCNFSDWKYKNQSVAVRIAGPDQRKDSYNSSNSNLFLKQSFEGFNTVVVAKNTRFCDFLYARLEDSKTFVKFIGECRQCRVSADYNSGCKLYDDSESLRIPIRVDECVFNQFASFDFSSPKIVNNKAGQCMAYIEGCGFLSNISGDNSLLLLGRLSKVSPLTYENQPALIINSAGGKLFRVSSTSQCTIRVIYLTSSDSKPINKSSSTIAPRTLINSSFSKINSYGRTAYSVSLHDGNIYFCIPDSIGSIQISFGNSPHSVSLACTGSIPEIDYPSIIRSGSSSSRPEYAYVGQFFYDTTIGSYLYWNGLEWIKI